MVQHINLYGKRTEGGQSSLYTRLHSLTVISVRIWVLRCFKRHSSMHWHWFTYLLFGHFNHNSLINIALDSRQLPSQLMPVDASWIAQVIKCQVSIWYIYTNGSNSPKQVQVVYTSHIHHLAGGIYTICKWRMTPPDSPRLWGITWEVHERVSFTKLRWIREEHWV